MRSILITGAGGFLGTHTVEKLLARGVPHLRCLVRSRRLAIRLFESYPQSDIELQTGNLLSIRDLEKALDGIDTVFHLAAEMKGAPPEIYMNTVVGSKRLLEAGRNVRRFVLVSSFGVYGVNQIPRGSIIDEDTPLEPHPERRDAYSFAKLKQELLFREYQQKFGFELVVLRPGVIYGPGSTSVSTRIGLNSPGLFLHVGGRNLLPLSYVENAADAIAMAGTTCKADSTLNVVDDDLVSCREYLNRYRRAVRNVRPLPIPYSIALNMSRLAAWYNRKSRGQLPAVLTPYKAAALWRPHRFRNDRLKAIGWTQKVSTTVGLERTFASVSNPGSLPSTAIHTTGRFL
jgi:nucleoside-diphosphate-sugar epimerase